MQTLMSPSPRMLTVVVFPFPITIGGADNYLLVATQPAIMQVSMDGMRFRGVVNGLTQGVAIDYDYR